MTFQDIRFAMETSGVDQEDIEVVMAYCKKNGTDYEKLDEILMQRGYEKVFTDEFFGWDDTDDNGDDEYDYMEKNNHKHVWDE